MKVSRMCSVGIFPLTRALDVGGIRPLALFTAGPKVSNFLQEEQLLAQTASLQAQMKWAQETRKCLQPGVNNDSSSL